MQITELRREDEKAWDSYVLKSSTSTFYHQLRSVRFDPTFSKFDGREDVQAQTRIPDLKRRSGYVVLT